MTSRPRFAVLAALLALAGCNKVSKELGDVVHPERAAIEKALKAATWVGKLDQSVMRISFSDGKKGLAAQIEYTLFGGVRNKDKLEVRIEDGGEVVLVGAPTNPVIGNPKTAIPELRGKLNPDKTELGGPIVRADGVPHSWSVSSKQDLATLDPPLDLAAAEAALLKGKWAGKVGSRPATLTVSKKGGGLVAKMKWGSQSSTFQVHLDEKGMLQLTAQPRPSSQGLIVEAVRGYVLHRDLAKLVGSHSTTVKQGFIEQSSSEAWAFEDLHHHR